MNNKKNKNTKQFSPSLTVIACTALVSSTPLMALQAPEQFLLDDSGGSTRVGTTADGKQRFEIRGAYAIVEGDIVLGKIHSDGELETPLLSRGIGRDATLDRWTDGIVYYQMADSLSPEDREKAVAAVQHWNNFSSITMTERTTELQGTVSDYINFEPSGGCASWVGKIGGEQAVWIGPTCTAGSVIHEIGHAIGLFHEHTRSDRDSFISVNLNNILEGKDFNFDIMDVGAADLGSYDYASIMHYGPRFFSKNGQDTITAPDGIIIGQREALSSIDLSSVNEMYGTDLTLSESSVADGTDAQLNLTLNNIGQNGAHKVSFRVPLAADMVAKSFSGENWSCSVQTAEVICDLASIAENTESTLALIVDPGATDPDTIQGYVTSKTFDTDLSNNGALPANYEQAGIAVAEPNLGAATGDEGNGEANGGGTSAATDSDAETDSGSNASGDQNSQGNNTSGNNSGDTSGSDTSDNGSSGGSPNQGTTAPSGGGGGALWPWLLAVVLVLRRFRAQR